MDKKLSRRHFMAGMVATAATSVVPGLVTPALARSEEANDLPRPEDCDIDHIVLVTMENRSFDHMLGWVPGANGKQAGLQYPDKDGVLRTTYRITPDYQGSTMEDPPHGYADGRLDVNKGAMDGFLHAESVGDTFPIGYYTDEDLAFYAGCAKEWTICDRYHTGILASTQPNRMYLHCGQTDRTTTGTGLPKLSALPTIWDAARAKGISAKYYYSSLPYTSIWGPKFRDISFPLPSFLTDAARGTLPAISYVDPFFYCQGLDGLCNDDHPFADVRKGQNFLNHIYNALRASPNWSRTLLVINYDEWGGFFDHVTPPFMPVSQFEHDVVGNDGQLGIRVPCILIGPRVRKAHVDSTLLEPNSILKFMEWRWGLTPLGVRSFVTNNLASLLDFENPPRIDSPAFDVPEVVGAGNSALVVGGNSQASKMSASMAAHAQDNANWYELARQHGFVLPTAHG